jgi:hypothetical protein
MVFNATFNNITAISWQSVLLLEESGGPRETHQAGYEPTMAPITLGRAASPLQLNVKNNK